MEGDSKSKRQAQKRAVKKAKPSEAATQDSTNAAYPGALPTSPQTTASLVKKKTGMRKAGSALATSSTENGSSAGTVAEPEIVTAPRPATATAKPSPRPAEAAEPSVDEIALRAYFIAENRKKKGLPGDETSDWVQAEQELTSDLAR